MPSVIAYGCDDATTQFHPLQIDIREPGEGEIYFEVAYAGICHSDIHSARGEWGPVAYPLVPGHEFVGTVAKVGPGVTTFKVGDRVGVGCLVGSCGTCEMCESGYEQWCTSTPGTLWTYRADAEGNPTTGGYSRGFTVRADFALHIPSELDFAACAPLLCAGITTYSPLKHYNVGPGSRVAILGLGGLGHVGVQIAKAVGADVSVISHGRSKEADARRFGADHFYATSEEGVLESLRGSFDLILCTVSADGLDYAGYMAALRPYGVFVDVGLPTEPVSLPLRAFVNGGKSFAGSQIGGIAETQEMLDFCAEHGVIPQVEMITGEDITEAYGNVVDSRVRYRYVIDTSTFPETA